MKHSPCHHLSLIILPLIILTFIVGPFLRDKIGSAPPPGNAVVQVSSFGNEGGMAGSGFIIKDGLVLTGSHVIGDPTSELYIANSQIGTFSVELVFMDPLMDIALLRITANTEDLPYLTLSDSRPELGQSVETIDGVGEITGLNQSVSAGKSLLTKDFLNLLRFDAPATSGSSGGPLLNMSGEVIGLIVAYTPYSDNHGYAIPIDRVKDFLEKSI